MRKNSNAAEDFDNQGNKIFLLASKISFDGIWDWNILTNEFYLGDGFEKLFGECSRSKDNADFDWTNHLHDEDKEAVKKGLNDVLASSATYWEHVYRFIRPDGSIAKVIGRANIIRDADGVACRMIGTIHDLSMQMELEEKQLLQTRLNEKQIAEATEEARETERSDIGRELHDNVNQLLATSRMYLEIARRGGQNSDMYLSRCSEFTLTAIEEIRKLTKGLTSDIINDLGLSDAIQNLSYDTMEANPVKISCTLNSFKEDSVTNKFKLNAYRIVQEQLNNILKHARAKEVKISLFQNKEEIKLKIADNGIGFDVYKKRNGIGIDNIKNRAGAYKGSAEFASLPEKGCVLTVTFPVGDVLF